MKNIVGLLTAWCAEKFIAPQIEQAIKYCDEVIVSIHPHSSAMKKHEDKTKEIALKYKDKVKFVEGVTSNLINISKAKTLTKMLKKSDNIKKGNWIWLLDVDEFYTDTLYEKVVDVIDEDKYNFIEWYERYFFIDMNHYAYSKRARLWKIDSPSRIFTTTNKWTGDRSKRVFINDWSFHYSLLLDPKAKIDFWKTEHGNSRLDWVRWMNEIYLNYSFDKHQEYLDKCKKIFKINRPILHYKSLKYNNENNFFSLVESNPPVIKKYGLDEIQDFRKLYE